MPLFEYTCEGCQERFELIVSRSTAPECPRCQSQALHKHLSAFAVGGAKSEGPVSAGGCGRCGDPRGPGACQMD